MRQRYAFTVITYVDVDEYPNPDGILSIDEVEERTQGAAWALFEEWDQSFDYASTTPEIKDRVHTYNMDVSWIGTIDEEKKN